MKRLLAIAMTSAFILTGCASEPEFGKVSSAPLESQNMQAESGGVEENETEDDESWRAKLDHFLSLPKYTPSSSSQPQEPQAEKVKSEEERASVSEELNVEPTSPSQVLQSPRTFETVTFVDSAELCKIPELFLETDPPMPSKGFPISDNKVPYLGIVNVDVIFIDFSNAKADSTHSLDEYERAMQKAVQWSKFYSGGKMTYNIRMHKEWLRAPKEAQEYLVRASSEEYAKTDDWIRVADPHYDFSNTHFVYFIVPKKAHFELGADMYGSTLVSTDEGMLAVPVWTYYAEPDRIWDHLIHEIMHDQGIGGHGPANGSSFGVMMGQWYGSKSLTSWETFLLGWLRNEDVVCIDARDGIDSVSVRLNSLDKLGAAPGIKSLIIRTSETEATIVEYRTDGMFSDIPKRLHGVTVYNLDVAKKWHRCDSCGPQEYEDRKNWWNYVRRPNSFDGSGNNNVNFGNGVIPTTSGFFIEVSDESLISIHK
jgi:hypothetical protein